MPRDLETCPEKEPVGGVSMDVLTSVKGQPGLPRYFASAYQVLQGMGRGRLDFDHRHACRWRR